jgi:hypothetical protein
LQVGNHLFLVEHLRRGLVGEALVVLRLRKPLLLHEEVVVLALLSLRDVVLPDLLLQLGVSLRDLLLQLGPPRGEVPLRRRVSLRVNETLRLGLRDDAPSLTLPAQFVVHRVEDVELPLRVLVHPVPEVGVARRGLWRRA